MQWGAESWQYADLHMPDEPSPFQNDHGVPCIMLIHGGFWKKEYTSELMQPIANALSDAGVASWYDLAIAIGEIAEEIGLISKSAKVNPIPSSSYPTKALRPNFSVLDCSETYKLLGLTPIHWRASLYELLKELT